VITVRDIVKDVTGFILTCKQLRLQRKLAGRSALRDRGPDTGVCGMSGYIFLDCLALKTTVRRSFETPGTGTLTRQGDMAEDPNLRVKAI
jgi:hypothetical protein